MGRNGFLAKAAIGSLAAGLVLGAIAPAQAQRVTEPNRDNRNQSDRGPVAERVEFERIPTINEAYAEAYFDHSKDYPDNRGVGRTLAWIFGVGFTENEITQDAENIQELTQDVLRQQSTSDPTIRTVDMPNPYNTSFMELRNSGAGL